jgi:hypothetical protein
MFNYNFDDIKLSETETGKKMHSVSHNIMLSRDKMIKEEKEKIRKREEKLKEANEEGYKKIVSKKKLDQKKDLAERMENLNSYTKILLTEGLTNIIFESINLDRKFKVNNEKGIKNSVRFLIEKMVDEGLINKENLEKTNAMSSLYNEACKYAEEALDEDIELVLSKFNEDEEVTEVSGDVSEFVKDKVVDVINKEKQIAEQNKEDEEEIDEKTEREESEENDSEEEETVEESFISAGYHKVESEKPTLFRSIAINAGREPVSEGINQNLEINNTISESIIQYTILETLHTTKLLEFSARDAQELAFKYYFNPKE